MKIKVSEDLTFSNTEGHSDHTISTRSTIQTADVVRQVVKYTQVMLNNNDVP